MWGHMAVLYLILWVLGVSVIKGLHGLQFIVIFNNLFNENWYATWKVTDI